jgi:hypothetical protein
VSRMPCEWKRVSSRLENHPGQIVDAKLPSFAARNGESCSGEVGAVRLADSPGSRYKGRDAPTNEGIALCPLR